MAFSVSPSVTIREVDASAAIPAISTPPAGLAGVFRWGPANEPILITSENQLVGRFGAPTDNNFETFFTAADFLSYSNALYVVRADNGAETASATDSSDANNVIHAAFSAKYPGALGNSIDVSYVEHGEFEKVLLEVGDIPSDKITAPSESQSFSFNSKSIVFEVLPEDRISGLYIGDLLEVGNESVGFQNIKVVSLSERALDDTGSETANTANIEAYEYSVELESNYILVEPDMNKLRLTKRWAHGALFGKQPESSNYHIAVIDRTGDISGSAGTVVEVYENVSTSETATLSDGRNNYYANVIENASSWVSVANTEHFETQTSSYETLMGGSDGATEATTSLGQLAAAYDTFKNSNEIEVAFILQGKADVDGNLANYLISNIADSRKDCVVFVSPPKEAVVDELQTNSKLTKCIEFRNKVQPSSYSFFDSGYKYRYDKYNDKYRFVPLNGDMAGLCSRVEPFESPAGFRKGVVKNIVKLAFNPSKAQRDFLYGSDINPVVSQVGQGVVLFGDKTGLGTQSAFDRINVRRLFIAVEKAIANAAQNFLFELNDEYTQTQFKNIVEPFLRDIQGRRGITDFRVVSDSTVNTEQVIDTNGFRANIFIKPARSINTIELTFVATRSGVEFEEIVGSIN